MTASQRSEAEETSKLRRALADAAAKSAGQTKVTRAVRSALIAPLQVLSARDDRLREIEAEKQSYVTKFENVRCQLDESLIAYEENCFGFVLFRFFHCLGASYMEMEKRYKAQLSLLQEADRINRKAGHGSIARPVQQSSSGIVRTLFGGGKPVRGGGGRVAVVVAGWQ